MTLKTQLQALVAMAGRQRVLRQAIVRAVMTLNTAHLIRPESAQTTIRLADSALQDLQVRRRVRFAPNSPSLELELPARYPAALRLALEDVYRHPSEGASLRVFGALARGAQCIADVGAHVGLYTYVAATLASSSARIYAFEPLPDLWATIDRNITRNTGRGRMRAIAAAVGSQPGHADLRIPRDTHFATLEPGWLKLHAISEYTTQRVEVVALDGFFAAEGAAPDLLKIDVEGHEQDVLEGMAGIIETHHPDVIIELIGAGRGQEIIHHLIAEWGYRVFFIADGLRELGPDASPPAGELHNFLVTRRGTPELSERIGVPVYPLARSDVG